MKPQTRRYTPDEDAAAVGMFRTQRDELGTEDRTVQRLATRLCTAWSRCANRSSRPHEEVAYSPEYGWGIALQS